MNKTFVLTLFCFFSIAKTKSQNTDTLKVYYYENFPYAYTEKGVIKGIELEIMDEFINWLGAKKNIKVEIVHRQYLDFNKFYYDVRTAGPKVIGMGSVTNILERETDVAFSPPYLQNIAVLITNGNVVSAKSKSKEEVTKIFNGMIALTIPNSSHEKYLNELKLNFLPNLVISSTDTQNNILNTISKDKKTFAYIDIVAYWSYLKMNTDKSLKIQKQFNAPKELLGYILPKNSIYSTYINEFFENGFGFTSTKKYNQILEKYLGYEIIEDVEIK